MAENEKERQREHETSGLGEVEGGVERERVRGGCGCLFIRILHGSAHEMAMLLEVISGLGPAVCPG